MENIAFIDDKYRNTSDKIHVYIYILIIYVNIIHPLEVTIALYFVSSWCVSIFHKSSICMQLYKSITIFVSCKVVLTYKLRRLSLSV